MPVISEVGQKYIPRTKFVAEDEKMILWVPNYISVSAKALFDM